MFRCKKLWSCNWRTRKWLARRWIGTPALSRNHDEKGKSKVGHVLLPPSRHHDNMYLSNYIRKALIRSALKIWNVSPCLASADDLGCMANKRPSGDIPGSILTDSLTNLGNVNSPEACANHCQTKYFALEYRTYCWCGNKLHNVANHPRLPEADCSMSCPADSAAKCGGSFIANVYRLSRGNASCLFLVLFR